MVSVILAVGSVSFVYVLMSSRILTACGCSLLCSCFSCLFIVLVLVPQVRQKGHFSFTYLNESIIHLSIKAQTCAKDVEHKKTCPVFHAGFCFTFPCIMHTKQMPFNALFPLFPLHLLLCPPPPDMFIYRGASCANRLFGRCTVNLRETGSNRSRTTKPLQSTPFFLLPGSF